MWSKSRVTRLKFSVRNRWNRIAWKDNKDNYLCKIILYSTRIKGNEGQK